MLLNKNEKIIVLNVINDLLGFPFKEDTSIKFDHDKLRAIWKEVEESDENLSSDVIMQLPEILKYYLTLDHDSESTIGYTKEEIAALGEKLAEI
jgi:UV DNA damage repair endonuclease